MGEPEPRWLDAEPPGIDELLDITPQRGSEDLAAGLRHQMGLDGPVRRPAAPYEGPARALADDLRADGLL